MQMTLSDAFRKMYITVMSVLTFAVALIVGYV